MTVQDAAKSAWFWVAIVFTLFGASLGVVEAGGYAKASTVHHLEIEQARQAGIVQGMADRVAAIFEMARSDYYLTHHIIIPDPTAPTDGGAR